jgi:serine/threonine protein kinase
LLLTPFEDDTWPVWEALLKHVCERWNLVATTFLGSGYGGVVVAATNAAGERRAVKMGINRRGDEIKHLKHDWAMREAVSAKNLDDLFVGVEGEFLETKLKVDGDRYDVAAFVQTSVGDPPNRSEDFAAMIESLQHLHEQNFIHGDARVPNVVMVNGQLKWIDLGASRFAEKNELKVHDMETLIRSLTGTDTEGVLPEDLSPWVEAYDGTSVTEIIANVRKYFPDEE